MAARLHRRLASFAYASGLASGAMYSWSGGVASTRIFWRGKRCYFLWWPRWKWRCVLKFHHWPTPEPVAFGLCGRCIPWPCCGAITREHAPNCEGEV